MRKSFLTYRTALLLALGISLLLNLLLIIMFIYGREGVIPADRPAPPPFSLKGTTLSFVFNFLLAFTLYIISFAILKTDEIRPKRKMLILILAGLLTTFFLSYLFSSIHLYLSDFPHRYPKRFFHGGYMRDFIICLIVLFSSEIIYLLNKKQQMELENKSLLSENMKTQYEVLKNQVNPHFLFNTLNTLNSLIKIDANKAQDYVQELSTVFRYTLQDVETVTLAEEMHFTHSFCNLMLMRYGKNLQFEERINPVYNNYLVLPLSIQTLIENAIKHNVISNRYPLIIYISTENDDTLTVSNIIREKREQSEGEGIGLSNLAKRYKLKWQKEIVINNTNNMFTVTIPLIPASS